MTYTIQLRRDLAENWTVLNPVLHAGEIGLELDTGHAKMGDGVTRWASLDYWNPAGAGGSGDLTYSQNVNAQSNATVVHGFDKYPAVSIMDAAGDEVEADIVYVNLNSLTVTFSSPFTGTIVCN